MAPEKDRSGRVLLNIDLGEMPAEPELLYRYAHLANIACGGHAGDDASMRRAVELCRLHGVRIGAHPSYPDREGFGRRAIAIDLSELRASVVAQCARLAAIACAAGGTVAFAKAHGALYHAADRDTALAAALVGGVREALGADVTLVGPPRGALRGAASSERMAYAREGFADRAMRPDGTLIPRDQPGALLLDPAIAADQARRLAASGEVETLCVHGDTPDATAIARAVRRALDDLEED